MNGAGESIAVSHERAPLDALPPENWTRFLAIVAAVLVVCVAFGVAAQWRKSHDGYVLAVLAHGVVFCAAVAVVVRRTLCRRALWLILAVAVVLRAIAFHVPVGLTTDGYRYVWDGRLQAAAVNPYLTVPADDRLRSLRDEAIYPNINGKETYPTIYPPAAQMAFLLGTRLIDGIDGIKILMALCEGVVILGLLRWLAIIGLPRERVLIYAWHPLPMWEYTSAGHIDALAAALLVLAILSVSMKRSGWAGAALAGVALTKYWPVYFGAALWGRYDWRMIAAAGTAVVLLYIPYVAPQIYGFGFPGVPIDTVLGSLFKHLNDEGYNQEGWGFFLAYAPRHFGLWSMSGNLYAKLAAVVLLVLAAVMALRRRAGEPPSPAALIVLATAFLLLISPHYPWYFAIAVPLLAAKCWPPLLWVTLAVTAIYLEIDYVWLTPYPRFKVYLAIHGGFLALVAWQGWRALRRTGSPMR